MARGPKPAPTHLKRLRGNPGKRALPQDAPHPAPALPAPPAHLGLVARAEWDRLAPELHRVGLLTMADRTTLAGYCALYQRWQEAEEGITALLIETPNGFQVQHPNISIANKALELMHKYMLELGLTPSSRVKLTTGAPPGEDPLDAFVRAGKPGRR